MVPPQVVIQIKLQNMQPLPPKVMGLKMHGSWLLLKYIILMVTDLSLSSDHFQEYIQKKII